MSTDRGQMHEAILEFEHAFWRAAGDAQFYEEHFADEGIMAFHVGVMDKPAVLDSMIDPGQWMDFVIEDVRFVDLSDEIVALTTSPRHGPRAGRPTIEQW